MCGITGVPPKQLRTVLEHSYSVTSTKSGSASSQSDGPGYTTSSTKGGDCNVLLDQESPSTSVSDCTIQASVALLSTSYEQVGTAIIMTGNQLHGHDIPDGFVRIVK